MTSKHPPAAAGSAWVRLNSWPRGPRVYRKQIRQHSPGLSNPGRVGVLGPDDELLGWGLYHPRSQVAVRILRRGDAPPDDDWIRARAAAAAERRLAMPELRELTALRVVHAEGDDLPGLVVDRYNDVLCAEVFSATALELFDLALPVLEERLGTRHWRIAFDAASAEAEQEEPVQLASAGCPERVRIEEGGLRFELDLRAGHKTGFFCDQRENRARLAAHAAGRSVLDVCCYTGGFALQAAAAGAREVLAVDLDEAAVELAKRNANLNAGQIGAARKGLRFVHADAYSYLRTLLRNERRFDVVVLDPPKFLRTRREQEDAVARYHDLNKLGLQLVAPGGLLLTCSCSGMLPLSEFQDVVRRAARGARRTARLLRCTGAGPDHPVRVDVPESAYLKALWLAVD